jgi:hypothetical protein
MSADAGDAAGAGTVPAAPGTGQAGGDDGGAELLEGMLAKDGKQGGQQEGEGDGEDLAAQLAHWKEMARKHEKRARENAGAAERLKKIDQANMTEAEKVQAELAEARRERDEARATHARVMAAAANNLPMELIDHLGTGTDEEINERAELFSNVMEAMAVEIAEQMIEDKIASGELVKGNASNGDGRNGNGQGAQQPAPLGRRPVESLRAGSAPAGSTPTTNEDWFRQLLQGS